MLDAKFKEPWQPNYICKLSQHNLSSLEPLLLVPKLSHHTKNTANHPLLIVSTGYVKVQANWKIHPARSPLSDVHADSLAMCFRHTISGSSLLAVIGRDLQASPWLFFPQKFHHETILNVQNHSTNWIISKIINFAIRQRDWQSSTQVALTMKLSPTCPLVSSQQNTKRSKLLYFCSEIYWDDYNFCKDLICLISLWTKIIAPGMIENIGLLYNSDSN